MAIAQEDFLITIKRPSASEQDSYVKPTYATVATGVRASSKIRPLADTTYGEGQQEASSVNLICDPVDVQYTDLIINEDTGEQYIVAFVVYKRVRPLSAGVPPTLYDYMHLLCRLVKGENSHG